MNEYSAILLPTNILQRIAANHKAVRKQKGWTQKELAERSGVSLGSLKRFEQSGRIALENLLQLAHVLGRLQDFERLLVPLTDLEEVAGRFSPEMRS